MGDLTHLPYPDSDITYPLRQVGPCLARLDVQFYDREDHNHT